MTIPQPETHIISEVSLPDLLSALHQQGAKVRVERLTRCGGLHRVTVQRPARGISASIWWPPANARTTLLAMGTPHDHNTTINCVRNSNVLNRLYKTTNMKAITNTKAGRFPCEAPRRLWAGVELSILI
jgi:hypothetical protein